MKLAIKTIFDNSGLGSSPNTSYYIKTRFINLNLVFFKITIAKFCKVNIIHLLCETKDLVRLLLIK